MTKKKTKDVLNVLPLGLHQETVKEESRKTHVLSPCALLPDNYAGNGTAAATAVTW